MNGMSFKKIVVAGGGVLGSQIAFQAAYKGFDVTLWLRSEGSVERTKPKVEALWHAYLQDLEQTKAMIGNPKAPYARGLIDDFENLTAEKIDELKAKATEAYGSLRYEIDLAEAVKDADLVIESVAEIPDVKTEFYETMAPLLPEHTVVVTNSSTLLPSMFAQASGRPEKYLAMHFANHIWRNNPAEIMGHDSTEKQYYDQIVEFSYQIGMIPLQLHKEQAGYLLNSLLVPFLSAAEALLVNEVADPETIDMAWVLGTGAPAGPCRILDVVGLETAYNIVMMRPDAKDPESTSARIGAMLKEYIDQGKTGVASGEGFYKYR